MKVFILLTSLSIVGSCATKSHKEKVQEIKDNIEVIQTDHVFDYSKTITADELKYHLSLICSSEYEGRATGTKGQRMASKYLMQYYKSENIASPIAQNDYYQDIPGSYFGDNYNNSENVVAYIKGNTKPEEVVVICGHFDHEGVSPEGEIYYGADDNGSGTSAILEIAQAFKIATQNGHGPERSVVFLHTTAEEIGLFGSRFYTENPIFPLENTVANLNIDMIGRVDASHDEDTDTNYIYLIGTDRASNELHYLSEAVNDQYTKLHLDYRFNDHDDNNRYFYRSDHYNFARHNIPVIFYFSGVHEDYSAPTDTADKIDYELLEKRSRLIFATAWQLANQPERVVVDLAQ